jgi:hypothetical protein
LFGSSPIRGLDLQSPAQIAKKSRGRFMRIPSPRTGHNPPDALNVVHVRNYVLVSVLTVVGFWITVAITRGTVFLETFTGLVLLTAALVFSTVGWVVWITIRRGLSLRALFGRPPRGYPEPHRPRSSRPLRRTPPTLRVSPQSQPYFLLGTSLRPALASSSPFRSQAGAWTAERSSTWPVRRRE